jgi:hypothetical protein
MGQGDKGASVVLVEPLGDVPLRKIGDPLVDIRCLELSQAALCLFQVAI